MGDVLRFPGHKLKRCTSCDGCSICQGGLVLCVTCGGAEGSLPTDCPGGRMSELLCNEVHAGRLDYRRRRGWVEEPNYPRFPCLYS